MRMMMVFQCDNSRINAGDIDTTKTSTDGCKTDLGVTNLHKMCENLVFAWSPGSQGEALPSGKGIEAIAVRQLTVI